MGVAAGVAACSNRRSTIIPGAAGAVVDLTVGGGIAACAEYGVLGEWNMPGVVGAGVVEATEAAVECGVCWHAVWVAGRTEAGW